MCRRPRVTRPLPLRRDRPLPATRDAYGNRPRVGGAVGRNAPGVEQRQHVRERMLAAVGADDHRPRLDDVEHVRSEEHTSKLQSHHDLVCRLLLEKKKTPKTEREPTTKISAQD